MNDWKILAVKTSWSFFLLNAEESSEMFYQRLFELDASLKPLFKHDLQVQTKKLVDMITFIVTKIQKMDDISHEMNALAQRHVHYGTQAKDYQTIGQALIETLEKGLGERWNKETEQAWVEAYAMVANTMIEASSAVQPSD